jgi:hypothetical protein
LFFSSFFVFCCWFHYEYLDFEIIYKKQEEEEEEKINIHDMDGK